MNTFVTLSFERVQTTKHLFAWTGRVIFGQSRFIVVKTS